MKLWNEVHEDREDPDVIPYLGFCERQTISPDRRDPFQNNDDCLAVPSQCSQVGRGFDDWIMASFSLRTRDDPAAFCLVKKDAHFR